MRTLVTEISSSLVHSRRDTSSVRFIFLDEKNGPFKKSVSLQFPVFLDFSYSSSLGSSSSLIHQNPIMVQP